MLDKDEPPILLGKIRTKSGRVHSSFKWLLDYYSDLSCSRSRSKDRWGRVNPSGRHRFSRPSWTSEKVRNGYEKIKVTFKVKSNAPKERVRSPVFDIISNNPTHWKSLWRNNVNSENILLTNDNKIDDLTNPLTEISNLNFF